MLLLINLATVTACFADPGDGLCDGDDGGPDGCPLDTWVWVLLIAAVIFAVIQLRNKKTAIVHPDDLK